MKWLLELKSLVGIWFLLTIFGHVLVSLLNGFTLEHRIMIISLLLAFIINFLIPSSNYESKSTDDR